MNWHRRNWGSRLFDFANHLLLIICAWAILAPFIYLLLSSFATNAEVDRGAIIPTEFTLDAYRAALTTPLLVNGFLVSLFITLAGTALSMLVTTMLAYSLSKQTLPGRRGLLVFVVLTILFNAGLIPLYLVVRSLGLLDSVWSLIIPAAVNSFNVILMKNFFLTIPDEIEDAARLDGCNDLTIFLRVVLPLSKPALATFSLFYAVSYWNSYFNAVMFITDPAKMPLQVALYQLISVERIPEQDIVQLAQLPYPFTLRAAAVVISLIPILLVYPFLQRYFNEGILLGGVKE